MVHPSTYVPTTTSTLNMLHSLYDIIDTGDLNYKAKLKIHELPLRWIPMQHNELRDLTSALLAGVCSDVRVEPPL